jgi:hypothetical protein
MSLSSSTVYVALIRRNSMSIESLKLAHEWHAGDVGDIISTLRNRLHRRFDHQYAGPGKSRQR